MDHLPTFPVELEEPSPASRPAAAAPLNRAPSFSPRLCWLILAGLALVYVGVCFTPVIFDDNEGLYAGAVREMHARSDWLLPTSNGFPRVQKPPLVYWTMLVSISVLGENEFALRLPNALATAGWIVATWLIARRVGGERFGLAAALVLFSMLGVWVFTHLVQPEPFLACFISLAVWCLVEARTSGAAPEDSGRWYFRFWVFLALGTMSKGLHGALWPLATAGIAALLVPGWRPWLRPILSLRGFLVFLLLVAPWYIYMSIHFPGFLRFHFLNEQLGSSLNTRFPPDARQLPIWQFYLQHLIFWLPWTLLFPASIRAAIQIGRSSHHEPFSAERRDVIGLLACWVGLVMVSVACSTRQDYYSLSCWGAVAAFLALPWLGGEDGFRRVPRSYLVVPCLLVAVAGFFSLGFAVWTRAHLAGWGDVTAAPIRSRDTFMDAIMGISPALWASLISLLAIFGMTMLAAGIWSGLLAWRRRFFAALFVLAGANVVPIGLAAAGFTVMSPYFSLAENARAINREIAAQPDALVACEALPNTASSLLYYLDARVHWVNAPFDNQYAQQVLRQGRSYYWDETALVRAWSSGAPVYLIVEESRLDHWRKTLSPAPRLVHKSGTRVVIANR